MFSVGQIVCLKTDISKKGAVVSISDENVINVFMDNKVQFFYPSQLLDISESTKARINFSTYTDFHNFMSSVVIQEPNNNDLLSLNTGKIKFIPYQYRPVLKFIKSDQPRLLIAD